MAHTYSRTDVGCDADPNVLSDYVLALLRHDEPETKLRAGLETQLKEFLEKEAKPFVEKLFQAIRSKSYVPYEDNPIAIPLDGLIQPPTGPRGTKRIAEDDIGSRYPSNPPRGPMALNRGRGNPQPRHIQRPPRTDPRQDLRGSGGQQPRKPCRDYHNIGYCPRGELCPYTHGDEAIVPQMPFGPGGAANGLPYNPMQMMSMLQNGFPMPWMMNQNGDISGAGPSNYQNNNKVGKPPDAVDVTSLSQSNTTSILPLLQSSPPPQAMNFTPPFFMQPNSFGPGPGVPEGDAPMDSLSYSRPQPSGRGRSGARTSTRGGSNPLERGTFPTQSVLGGSRRGVNDNTTIVVEKIPVDKLSLPAVNDWFTRFGTVTNVAIDAGTSKALVSFSTPEEARAAWGSKEAVFANRFVKLFWHRPVQGQGQAGTEQLKASAPLVQKIAAGPPPSPAASAASSVLARKELLERQIAQQKELFASLDAAPTLETKKSIMMELRQLGQEMKNIENPVLTPTTPQQSKIREKLDRELVELHARQAASASPDRALVESTVSAPAAADANPERQSELLAQLAELRKQAAEVGVPEVEIEGGTSTSRLYRGSPRGYSRGRGARGTRAVFPYSRGGASRGLAAAPRNMSLDNRSRRLVIKGVNVEDEKSMSAVEDWYKGVGELESFQASGADEVHVQFRTRAVAEQALAKGASISDVASVLSVSWHVSRSTPSAPSSAPVPSSTEALPADAINSGGPRASAPTTDTSDGVSSRLSPSPLLTAAGKVSLPPTAIGSGGLKRTVTTDDHDDGWGAGGGFDD